MAVLSTIFIPAVAQHGVLLRPPTPTGLLYILKEKAHLLSFEIRNFKIDWADRQS